MASSQAAGETVPRAVWTVGGVTVSKIGSGNPIIEARPARGGLLACRPAGTTLSALSQHRDTA